MIWIIGRHKPCACVSYGRDCPVDGTCRFWGVFYRWIERPGCLRLFTTLRLMTSFHFVVIGMRLVNKAVLIALRLRPAYWGKDQDWGCLSGCLSAKEIVWLALNNIVGRWFKDLIQSQWW